jgi:multimeric flavodoxin WrbA
MEISPCEADDKSGGLPMNIVAICGNYRKNGVTEQLLEASVKGAMSRGATVETLTLRDIAFQSCLNCKRCWNADSRGKILGECPIRDDLSGWLERIAEADGLILASPINFGSLTALFKSFQERCLAMTELRPLPRILSKITGMPALPQSRHRGPLRPMICITASGAPAIVGKWLMPCAKKQFRALGDAWHGRITDLIWAGGSMSADFRPPTKLVETARKAGERMADRT